MQIQDLVGTESSEQSSSRQVRHFEEVMIRAQTAYTFKEFYKQKLSELQYEMKMHKQRLIYYLGSRGSRPIAEKKKFKALGEINQICLFLKMVDQKAVQIDTDVEEIRQNI